MKIKRINTLTTIFVALILLLTLTSFASAQGSSTSIASERDRLQRGLDAALTKIAESQIVIAKADETIKAKDNELKDANQVIGAIRVERDLAKQAVDATAPAILALIKANEDQVKVIEKLAMDKARLEVSLENEKKKTRRWKGVAGVATVVALALRFL